MSKELFSIQACRPSAFFPRRTYQESSVWFGPADLHEARLQALEKRVAEELKLEDPLPHNQIYQNQRSWSEEEIAVLRLLWMERNPRIPYQEFLQETAVSLNRTVPAICSKLKVLKLTVPRRFRKKFLSPTRADTANRSSTTERTTNEQGLDDQQETAKEN